MRAPSTSSTDAMVGGYGGGSSRAPTPTRRERRYHNATTSTATITTMVAATTTTTTTTTTTMVATATADMNSGSNDVSDAATLNKKLRNASNGTLSEAEKEEVVSKIRPSTSLGFGNLTSSEKYVLAMVGLPARGKSYIVKMIIRYLQWTGVQARLFNVGNFRRQKGLGAVSANFFDTNNTNAIKERENLGEWLVGGGLLVGCWCFFTRPRHRCVHVSPHRHPPSSPRHTTFTRLHDPFQRWR